MRASRVSAASTATYQSARRYLDTEAAFTLMTDQQSLNHFQEQQKKKQKKQKPSYKNATVRHNKSHVLIKGILFNGEHAMRIRNELLQTSINVQHISQLKVRNRTYRESI